MTHQQAVDTLACERYFLGEMTELERHAFEAHYFSCADCAEDVRDMGRMVEGAEGLLAEPGISAERSTKVSGAKILSWRQVWKWQTVVPLAAAAMLAVMVGVVGYQGLMVGPGGRPTFGAQAVAPVVLTAAARGGAQTVHIEPGSSVVALMLDVNVEPPPDQLTYTLATDSGKELATGRTRPPVTGTPLLLIVPAETLRQPGDPFIVTIKNPASAGSVVGEYRFVVRGQ
ncbi:MAG TPA: zf-HC2 domain-containing protein [Vicinamibacterales bacterium]|nr:zf-HC2 domain-containing protein [Vicinamibacterales bacterium]